MERVGVIIWDMEKPKSCYECPLFKEVEGICPIIGAELTKDQIISASACQLEEVWGDK